MNQLNSPHSYQPLSSTSVLPHWFKHHAAARTPLLVLVWTLFISTSALANGEARKTVQVERAYVQGHSSNPNVSGVLMQIEYQKIQHLALSFEPDTRQVVIIVAASALIVVTLLVFALLVQVVLRRRAERQRDKRLRFQTLLSELSRAFVKIPDDDFDREVEKGLQRLVEYLGIDRGSIAEFVPNESRFYLTHSYAAPGFNPLQKDGRGNRFPWISEQIGGLRPVILSRLPDDLPDDAGAERRFCLRTNTLSTLIIPLSVGGSCLGALFLASLSRYRTWCDELVQNMQLVGEILANVLARWRSEESLKSSVQEIERLKEELQAENNYLQEEVKLVQGFEEIIGDSNELRYVLFKIEQVAPTDTTVLLLGETGTGKELAAQAIHKRSSRQDRPLVKVNCAALSPTLIEDELFGHEKGAFTGSLGRKIGRFELADRGTIFLDEIGELPLELQPKLLRVLQDGGLERLGGTQTIKVNVRVIAATNRDLKLAVEKGLFREDLLYRLNVFPITLPPLRQRKEDIPLLVNFFAKYFGKKLDKEIKSVAPDTMRALQKYPWPGNVRELANVIERAVINAQGPVLVLADNLEITEGSGPLHQQAKTLEEIERESIINRLEETHWKIEGPNGAAESLGLHPSTLRNRMHKLGIQRPEKHG